MPRHIPEAYRIVIVVRPRSQKYAHYGCIPNPDEWEDRRVVVRLADVDRLGACLVCGNLICEQPKALET